MRSVICFMFFLMVLMGSQFSAAQLLPPGAPKPAPPPSELEIKLAKVNDVIQLLAMAASFQEKGEYKDLISTLSRVAVLRPMAGNIQYELAAAYAQLDDKRQVYDRLLKLQMAGYAFDPSEDPRFEKAHGTEAWDYIVLNLQANAKPFGEGKVALTLPNTDTLIEAIAYDEKKQQFLAGSMRDGAIYRVSADGKTLRPFIAADKKNQLRAIVAMEADNKRGHLWVTATGMPHFKTIDEKHYGKTALYQFDLANGKLIKRYDLPSGNGPHALNYVHVSKSGRVFAVDSAQRRIYILGTDGLKLVMQNPKLTQIRGLTTSDDGRMLYFADNELGIFAIDLEQDKPIVISGPSSLTLFGIDGMYFWDGHLVIIQNAFPPARVMRLKLDATGTKIASSMPLDAGHAEFEQPTRGVITGDALYFIANSQKAKYDRYGTPIDAGKLQGVSIWKSDLKFALNSVLGKTEILIPPAK